MPPELIPPVVIDLVPHRESPACLDAQAACRSVAIVAAVWRLFDESLELALRTVVGFRVAVESRLDTGIVPVDRLHPRLRKMSVGGASSSDRLEGGEVMPLEIEVDSVSLESSRTFSYLYQADEQERVSWAGD